MPTRHQPKRKNNTKTEGFNMITQKTLKEELEYSSETGKFNRTKAKFGVTLGKPAGCICSTGYLRIKINGKKHQAHRLAWLYVYGEMPPEDIDHINHIRTDNRIKNLRLATREANTRNITMRKDNQSGFNGVSFKGHAWDAFISVDRKNKHLGRYYSKIDAIAARIRANKKYGYHKNHGVK